MNDAALQARQTMRYAFDRLKESVTADDASFFQITGLADVKSAARELEHNLADRQELRNLRRLEPLFEKLEALSKALRETHCGTQFIPWIWVCAKCHLAHTEWYTYNDVRHPCR